MTALGVRLWSTTFTIWASTFQDFDTSAIDMSNITFFDVYFSVMCHTIPIIKEQSGTTVVLRCTFDEL